MSRAVKIAIEGPHAERALREFLAIPGIQGHVEAGEESPLQREPGTLVVLGAIVGIASGFITITDKILAWRDHLKKEAKTKRLSVILEDAKGNRLLLEDATPAQVTAALESLTA